MKNLPQRITGFLLILLALGSLALDSFSLYQVWRLEGPATHSLQNGLGLLIDTLDASSQALDVIDGSLQAARASLEAIQETVQTLSRSLRDVGPLMDSLQTLTSKSLPATLDSTKTSLSSAQASAEIIEKILTALTSIPLFPGKPYQPEVPLYVSLGQIAQNLQEVKPTLQAIDGNLGTTQGNLSTLEGNIAGLATDIQQISKQTKSASDITREYHQQVQNLQRRLQATQKNLPRWTRASAWVLTFLICALAAAHLGLLFQGTDRIGRNL